MRVKHYKPRKDRCLDSVTVRAIREQYDVHGRSRRSIALEYGLNEGLSGQSWRIKLIGTFEENPGSVGGAKN